MAIIVTGAAGFIGRHVVRLLLARGEEVIGIDRRAWRSLPGEQIVLADLAEADRSVEGALAHSHGVVHLAARPGVRDRDADIEIQRWRDNVVAGERVLTTTPDEVPVVVASSSSVYGDAGSTDAPRACHEQDAVAPRGGYARSKVELERRCAVRAERGGLVGIVRPFTVAGEGQRPDMAFSRWIAALQTGRPLTLLGSPDRRRDFTDVHDVAEGIVRMLERRVTTTVNLGTGCTHRLDELIAVVAGEFGVPARVERRPAAYEEAATTRADTRRCQRLLEFTPTTDLRALVARQIAHLEKAVSGAPSESARPRRGRNNEVTASHTLTGLVPQPAR